VNVTERLASYGVARFDVGVRVMGNGGNLGVERVPSDTGLIQRFALNPAEKNACLFPDGIKVAYVTCGK
jgi:hypothetical protein